MSFCSGGLRMYVQAARQRIGRARAADEHETPLTLRIGARDDRIQIYFAKPLVFHSRSDLLRDQL